MEAKELSSYIEVLVNTCKASSIVALVEVLQTQEETNKTMEQYYEQQIEEKLIEACVKVADSSLTKEKLQEERIYDFLKTVIEEVAKNEDKKVTDVKEAGRGQYSKGFQIGEKVIKFGVDRGAEIIPYHRRILQPIIRRPVYNSEGTRPLFYIEIQEKVKDWEETEIEDEDVYQVYKELREDGILWVDAKIENLGRLKKPNIVHMKDFNQVEDSTVGIDREDSQKVEILPEGELIILDSDFIHRIDDLTPEEFKYFTSHYACHRYEEMYLYEKRREEKRKKKQEVQQGEER